MNVGQGVVAVVRDLRFAGRVLGRAPGFAVVAVVTLALGIGASVTVFSVTHAVLWRPLPYPNADRLVIVQFAVKDVADAGATPGELRDLRARSRLLESIQTISGFDAHVRFDGEYERVAAATITDGVLSLLGAAPPALGRMLDEAEDVDERVRSVVISDGLWRRRFGRDPATLGSQIRVNDLDVRVVGILRPGLRVFLPAQMATEEDIDVWFPTRLNDTREHDDRWFPVLGRLRPGVTLTQAQAELDALATQLVHEHPSVYPDGILRLSVRPLQESLTAEVQPALVALAGAVVLVLFISCMNVANLVLARSSARRSEFLVRRALGAGHAQLARQLLIESLLLAAVGGIAGLLIGYVGVGLVEWLRPSHVPRQSQIRVDGMVVLFTIGLSAFTALFVGLLPAMRVASDRRSLLSVGRADTASPPTRRVQRALVIAEVALSIVLLIATGLMLRTFVNLTRVSIGFEPSQVLTASAPMGSEVKDRFALYQEVLYRVRQLPGVEEASAGAPLPFGPWQATMRYSSEADPLGPARLATFQTVVPGYFRVTGTLLRAGRDFTLEDVNARQSVVVVDERIASQLWPDGAIGKRLIVNDGHRRQALEVIGVTASIRMTQVRDEGLPHFFVPYHVYPIDLSLLIKTRESAPTHWPAIRRAVASLGTGRAVSDVRPLTDYVDQSLAHTRFTLLVLLGFAVASLLLAAVGVHGTLAYLVSQRTRELGLRMALGASPSQVLGMVIGEAAVVSGIGVAIGLAGAFATMGALRSLIYEVSPFDSVTLLAVSAVVAVVATTAAIPPAWRAARVDPTQALRTE